MVDITGKMTSDGGIHQWDLGGTRSPGWVSRWSVWRGNCHSAFISGLMTLSGILGRFVEGFMSEGLGFAIRIVAVLLNIFGVVVAVAGGLVGGLVQAIIETS